MAKKTTFFWLRWQCQFCNNLGSSLAYWMGQPSHQTAPTSKSICNNYFPLHPSLCCLHALRLHRGLCTLMLQVHNANLQSKIGMFSVQYWICIALLVTRPVLPVGKPARHLLLLELAALACWNQSFMIKCYGHQLTWEWLVVLIKAHLNF